MDKTEIRRAYKAYKKSDGKYADYINVPIIGTDICIKYSFIELLNMSDNKMNYVLFMMCR